MKNVTTLLILSLFFFFGCGNQSSETEESTESPSGNTLLQEGMQKFDPFDIDENAEVVQIELISTGNTMTEMKYDKDVLTVPQGSTVELTLINQSVDEAMQHNFVLIEKGSEETVGPAAVKAGPDKEYVPDLYEVLVASEMLGPGETTTLKFRAPDKGAYRFICTYPGHYTIMQGDFIVE